jgi:hypothetical protein
MLHHRQTDAAQTRALGREKGIEGAEHGLASHSDAAVLDPEFDHNAMTLNDRGGVYRDQPASRHCVARVEYEIQDRVLQTQGIAFRSG